MNGWIKLYKKIWQSKNFKNCKNKANMILVWVWMLTHAEDGIVTFGRKQVAEDTGISESAVYRATCSIKRKMTDEANIKANSQFTTVCILNWHEYQDKPNKEVYNKRTTSEQQANTIKEDKNIDIKNITNVIEPTARGNPAINELVAYAESRNFILQGTKQGNRYGASNLLKKYDLDQCKRLIDASIQCRGQKYAPQISDFTQLYRKVGDLVLFYKKGENESRIATI